MASRGLTLAEFVQQVLYAIYKVRLDTSASPAGQFHSKSDKFKEVIMEANFVLQEFQKDADWNFLRERWDMGRARNNRGGAPQEIEIPEGIYKVCTNYGDAVRLHAGGGYNMVQIPFEEARTGNRRYKSMFDNLGQLNVDDGEQRAFCVGDILTFNRPWYSWELGHRLETDVISYIEPLHICGNSCSDACPKAYEDKVFTWMPDPYYFVVRTAAKRAEGDPGAVERVQSLTDEATKLLSAIRENDSAHTTPDSYETCELGYVEVL